MMKIIYRNKGATLMEAAIVAAVALVIIVSLLALTIFSRDVLMSSRDSVIAMNCLDTVMTYFENHISEWTLSFDWTLYADPSNTANIVKVDDLDTKYIPDHAEFLQVLNQLKKWKIYYRIAGNLQGTYNVRIVALKIEWDSSRKSASGAPVRMREELFTYFSSRSW